LRRTRSGMGFKSSGGVGLMFFDETVGMDSVRRMEQ